VEPVRPLNFKGLLYISKAILILAFCMPDFQIYPIRVPPWPATSRPLAPRASSIRSAISLGKARIEYDKANERAEP
jgi:hypothetical protein